MTQVKLPVLSQIREVLTLAAVPLDWVQGTTILKVLSTGLLPINGVRFRLTAADWDLAPGATPQFRVLVTFGDDGKQTGPTTPTTGDVLEVAVHRASDNTAIASATAVVAAPGGSTTVTRVATAWQDVPAADSGYVQVRNQTAARGAVITARVEIRYV